MIRPITAVLDALIPAAVASHDAIMSDEAAGPDV